MARDIRIGIDTGGTFTDVVALDEGSGELVTTKTPSTPANPAEGFMAGVHKVLGMLGRGQETVSAVSHGTTVATNQLLEDRISDLGFITTEGFEFILEIARQSVPDGYGNSYFWVKPPRIVPVHRVKTVGGRLDHTGAEVRPFDEDEAARVARFFKEQGITTIGVCFLHSYADPGHELAMRAVLAKEHPDAVISLSHEVLREYREYERSVTTLVDAAVKPTMMRYIAQIAERLDTLGGASVSEGALHPAMAGSGAPSPADPGAGAARAAGGAPVGAGGAPVSARTGGARAGRGRARGEGPAFFVMKSNGGVLSAEEVVHQPITTVLSGPAAGALGAALVAETAGYPAVLTLDGGGTSTDVAVVLDGEPTLTTEGSIGRFPSKIPMIDIVTVGAGGGSIAWTSPEGTLKVGPKSAGADPGPLCYGKGGELPTVTDAHALLGRIPPHLLGGEIPLDVPAAEAGLTGLATDLGLTVEHCATGILEISAWNQANAIRQITVKRGVDVRDYPMVAFGGSGPLLVCRLIDILSLPAVIVPENPGNLSAFGLLTVDVKNDYVQTYVGGDLDAVYADLERRAAEALLREGFPESEHRYLRTADLRYAGQAFEVRVPAGSDGPVDPARVVAAFHDAHQKLYGYCYREEQTVEWVNLRVSGVGPITRPQLRRRPDGDGDPERARAGTRRVFFADDGQHTPIYQRERLAPGDLIHGPAIIEEFGSTLPLHPGFTARADAFGNLIVSAR